MVLFAFARSRRVVVAAALCGTLTAGVAGASTIHRLVSQTTGSGGATTFLQTGSASSALQGEVASSPRTSITLPFGVLGEYDAGTSPHFGIGVLGISTSGYGVAAESLGNDQPGILGYGSSTGGPAIEAAVSSSSTAFTGLYADVENGSVAAEFYAEGIDGQALFAQASAGSSPESSQAIYADNNSPDDAAIVGSNYSNTHNTEIDAGDGVYASSNNGSGVFAEANYDPAFSGEFTCNAYADSGTTAGIDNQVCAGMYIVQDGTFGWPLLVYNSSSQTYPFYVTANGNLFISGTITQNNASLSRNPGTDELTYAPKQTESTVEDFGSAQLVNGTASVPLRADYKATINLAEPYMVFLTPHGESNNLYIASSGPQGFSVREAHGGRSTLAFDYRIVARPAGVAVKRLPHEADMHDAATPRTTGLRHTLSGIARRTLNRNATPHRPTRAPMPQPFFKLSAIGN